MTPSDVTRSGRPTTVRTAANKTRFERAIVGKRRVIVNELVHDLSLSPWTVSRRIVQLEFHKMIPASPFRGQQDKKEWHMPCHACNNMAFTPSTFWHALFWWRERSLPQQPRIETRRHRMEESGLRMNQEIQGRAVFWQSDSDRVSGSENGVSDRLLGKGSNNECSYVPCNIGMFAKGHNTLSSRLFT